MTSLLVCTLGGSWAVIPEVYAFLAPERLPLYRDHPLANDLARLRREQALAPPDEIWVCTTQGEETRKGLAALLDWHGRLPAPPPLRIWQAGGTDELANQAECEHMRELIVRVCLLAETRAEGGGRVVLSLAGGRKTMSADLQWAGSLLGCDALVHVVGCRLPNELTKELTVERMLAPLPGPLCGAVVPLIVGHGTRSDLLDVALGDKGPITSDTYPIAVPESRRPEVWAAPPAGWLSRELQERERAGSHLLGNYLSALSRSEHHENWRSLYRLPPRVIEQLRRTPLDAAHRDWLRSLPKADLHRHLGGCLDLAQQRRVGQAIWQELTIKERGAALGKVEPMLRRAIWGWDWSDRLKDDPTVPRAHAAAALLVEASDERLQQNLYGCTEPRVALKTRHPLGFSAYERPGDLSGSALLTHPAALDTYAACVVENAVDEGLDYVELRGSPQKYGEGMAFLHAMYAALQRALTALPEARRPLFRFIMIADRSQRDRIGDVVRMAVEARDQLGYFIAGLDLAGDEGTARPEEIAPAFLPAFESCLPITIHAGEGEPAESIWEAAYHLHADRIGHGLSISEKPELTQRFRDRGICLELCPTSNREVVGYRDPAQPASRDCPCYPLPELWRAGLPLTLCTDNPGISRTTLTDEYVAAARMTGGALKLWDVLALLKQAFNHAFLPAQDKEWMIKRLDAELYRDLTSGGLP